MKFNVMHGSRSKSPFPISKIKRKAYFTDNENVAKYFTRGTGTVMSAIVEMDHPYIIDWQGYSWGGGLYPEDTSLFEGYLKFVAGDDPEEREYWNECGLCLDMFSSFIAEKGTYDGMVASNVLEECNCYATVYVAFKNTKISPVGEND